MDKLITQLSTLNLLDHSVHIGVISDSVQNYEEKRKDGILPEIIFGYNDISQLGEGGAMIQILYQICPNCLFYFESDDFGVARAVRSLGFTFECDIIVCDSIMQTESPFQQDSISDAIADVSRKGVLFFMAAGNTGGDHSEKTRGFLQEDWNPVDTDEMENPIVEIPFLTKPALVPLVVVSFSLYWTDPIDKVTHDLVFAIHDGEGKLVASSDQSDLQFETRPFRSISTQLQTGSDSYRIRITDRKGSFSSAPIHKFRIFTADHVHVSLSRVSSGSVEGFSASGAIVVGAVSVKQRGLPRHEPFNANSRIASYSSTGPALKCFDHLGNMVSPPDCSPIFEPQTVAASGVGTDIEGFERFPGTSAAAPFAGGIAALLHRRFPFLGLSVFLQALRMESSTWSQSVQDKKSVWNPLVGYGPIDAMGMYRNLESLEATIFSFIRVHNPDDFIQQTLIDHLSWTPNALNFVRILRQFHQSNSLTDLESSGAYLQKAFDMCIQTETDGSNKYVKPMKELLVLLEKCCPSPAESMEYLCGEGVETLENHIDKWLLEKQSVVRYRDRRISYRSDKGDAEVGRRKNVIVPL